MSQAKRLSMVEKAHPHLSIVDQCALLKVPRSTHYYQPKSSFISPTIPARARSSVQ